MKEEGRHLKIAKSALALSVVSVIAVLISFGKESFIAYYYGASTFTDAYNISIDTPRVIFTFISMAISTVVVPVYTKELAEHGRDSANYFFKNFTTMVFISYLVLFVISEVSAHFIIGILAPGLNDEAAALATRLFRLTVPAMGLGLFCKINTGVLNSHKNFLLPSLAPILFNLSVIFSVLAWKDGFEIYAPIAGTMIGMVLELVFTGCLRKKYVSYQLVLNFHDKCTVSALKMAVPVFLGMGAAEINLVVDKVIASFFEAGSISALNYASKLSSGVSTLFIAGIATVIFPEMAEHVANGDKQKAARTYIFSVRIFIIVLMPIIVGGVFLSREVMVLVYGRGAFDAHAVAMTTPIFSCYFISLLFTGLRQVGTNFLYAHGDSGIAMRNTVVGVGINIILDIALSGIMGVAGLALATTLSAAVISILLMRSAKHKNDYVSYGRCLLLMLQTGFSCVVMAAVIWMFKKALISVGYYEIDMTRDTLFFTVSAVLIGTAVYCIMLLLLKVDEIYRLLNIVKCKVGIPQK